MDAENTPKQAGKDQTLHQRILNDIEGRILSGEWPPGHRVPFEMDLAAQYQCSRMTVNKVMTQLAKSGLIERRKKSGSFVTQPQAQSAILQIHDIETEVRALNLPYAFQLVHRLSREAKPLDKALLKSASAARVLDVQSLHFAGKIPFCLEQRLINLTIVPEAETALFGPMSPGAWLVQQVPWSAAEHRIEAILADEPLAAALQIPPQSACLSIERRTWNAAGSITHVRFVYPGQKHALVARFTPGQAE
jgi:GntR family histidine utilization transcriptional repressor